MESTLSATPGPGTWCLQQKTPVSSPSKRSSMGLAYDAARGQVVLFGGLAGPSVFADTWTWDGTTWTKRAGPP